MDIYPSVSLACRLDNNHEIFIGRSLGTQKSYSEATAADIDIEVKLIINKCYAEATKILTDNLDKLNKVANMLLENEKLSGEDFDNIFKEPKESEEAPEVVENVETVVNKTIRDLEQCINIVKDNRNQIK